MADTYSPAYTVKKNHLLVSTVAQNGRVCNEQTNQKTQPGRLVWTGRQATRQRTKMEKRGGRGGSYVKSRPRPASYDPPSTGAQLAGLSDLIPSSLPPSAWYYPKCHRALHALRTPFFLVCCYPTPEVGHQCIIIFFFLCLWVQKDQKEK